MKCALCHEEIENPENTHQYHRAYCPYGDGGPCTCDLGSVHDECCPEAVRQKKLASARWN